MACMLFALFVLNTVYGYRGEYIVFIMAIISKTEVVYGIMLEPRD